MVLLRADQSPERSSMSAVMRRWIIERSLAANVGHIGSALSIVEILAVLWGWVLRRPGGRLRGGLGHV